MRKQIANALIALALPAAALADITDQTLTIPVGQQVNLETGTVVASGGDLKWDGLLLTPQGSARVVGLGVGGDAAYQSTTLQTLQQLQTSGALQPGVPFVPSALGNQPVAGALTNAGHLAKIEVTSTATSGQSLAIKFTTYGATGSGGGGGTSPTISSIYNNYGGVAQGLPNYGIAPGALFVIAGSGLANTTTPLQSSAAPGLQTTLSGVTVTVSVGGTTLDCPLYYLSPTQIDAVLPGKTPVGIGTIVVTNNGTKSSAATLVVTQSAFGLLYYNGTLAATYDAGNALITSSNAANPGQTIAIWGSGVGNDPADDDKVYPQGQNNLANIAMQAYVGGLPATIVYRGRSQYPGVDQIVLTIPTNVTPGCWVSLAIVSGTPSIVSNGTTIPIAASGKTCSEPNSIFSSSVFQSLLGKTTIRTGSLILGQTTTIGGTTPVANFAGGTFQSFTPTSFTNINGGNSVSTGSCLVTNTNFSTTLASTTPLDAGTSINATGPQGSLALSKLSFGGQQIYTATTVPANFIPAAGGSFTYDNGNGGADVGHFNTATNFPANFSWTNASAVTAINRTQGVTVNWSGGAPGVTVTISGSAASTVNGSSVTGSFTCQAPLSAGTFTVPPPVLLALPSGSGTLLLTDNTNPQTFTASGLDVGYTLNTAGFTENVNYN
jgi:uncharacterized protein (TIGR03437 family)